MYDKYKLYKQIICIDIKAFYASVEANERGLDIYTTDLVVADPSRGEGAITLAMTPSLKNKGFKSRTRLFEIPYDIKKNLIIAKPQMGKYIDVSSKIYDIYLEYFDKNDIYVYSIDEVFIDVTNYLRLYKTNAFKLSLALKRKILNKLNINVCVGIGQNMVMAKFALDIKSKKTKYEIAEWNYENFQDTLWKVSNLSSVWGIGKQTAKKLYKLGIYDMGELAKADLELLHKKFGVQGVDLSLHANCIDPSILQEQKFIKKEAKSIGQSQVLFRIYNSKEIEIVVLEMLLEVILKLRQAGFVAKGISLTIGESKDSEVKGFSVRKQTDVKFDSYFEIQDDVLHLLRNNLDDSIRIKRLSLSLFNLSRGKIIQNNLFVNKKNNSNLDKTISELKNKFGKDKILLGISKSKEGNQEKRNKLIGGHNAYINKEEKN